MFFEPVFRAQVAQSIVDKFYGKPFTWGENDCVHLAAYTIRQLGHADPLVNTKSYGTARNALKAMKAAGVSDFADHIDGLGFERIGYASALPGDLVGFPGQFHEKAEESLALGVYIGNGRILGFANNVCDWADADRVVAVAWRVPVAVGVR